MSIPQSFIQELLARTDLVEVVGRYVQLKKGGANFMGLCPFHGEKSPSFSVSPAKQFYHCFGCGANGNAISFLMEHVGMGFVEAVTELAQQVGLPVPTDETSPQERERAQAQRQRQASLTELLEQAARAYQKQLKVSPRAVAYLKGRGLSGDIAKTFGIGYAPDGWRPLASLLPDYADNRLVEAGLVIASDAAADAPPDTANTREGKRYDRFRDRIMFPIRNVKGETIGFGGRVLDKGEPKYLNSPETPVFSKGRELYGLFEARTAIRASGYALVTEGYMDVVALAQLGFSNAVATLGTACTEDHVHKLFRFTDAVVFSFDGDAAGRRAAAKAMLASLPHAQDTRSLKFLFLPPEHDPDSFIRAHGTEAFAACVADAVPLSRFMHDHAASGCDLSTAEGRALYLSRARPLWLALPDGALKRQLLTDFAARAQLDAPTLTDLWRVAGSGHGVPSTQAANTEEPVLASRSPRTQTWNNSRSGQRFSGGAYRRNEHGSARHQPPLPATLSRAERVARTLLEHPAAWAWLTPEDQQLLAHQPAPLGALFAWLESQWHEHGPQPWAVLQPALSMQSFGPLAQQLVDQALQCTPVGGTAGEATEQDVQSELREMLNRMLIDDLKQRETQAIVAAAQEPQALATYRELQARRLALEQTQASQKL